MTTGNLTEHYSDFTQGGIIAVITRNKPGLSMR